MLDAARDYDGHNLLWANDADELISPAADATLSRAAPRPSSTPGTVIAPRFYTLWNGPGRYRDDLSHYRAVLETAWASSTTAAPTTIAR